MCVEGGAGLIANTPAGGVQRTAEGCRTQRSPLDPFLDPEQVSKEKMDSPPKGLHEKPEYFKQVEWIISVDFE